MPTPIYKTNKLTIDNISGYYIDSGAKHFVINYNKNFPDDSILKKIAQKIRYNKEYFPDGVNVNFYNKEKEDLIYVKTYEKGIESMMPSCASGSFACAYHFSKKNKISNIHINNDKGSLKATFNFDSKIHKISGNAVIDDMKEIDI